MEKSSLSVPLSIVIAGLIIGGAVYLSSRAPSQSPNPTNTSQNSIPAADISIKPVSESDYIRGNASAKVVLVEFSDTECPFCKAFHGTLKGLMDKYAQDGTLAWVYRNFPIKELHSKAPKEAEALLCAGKIGGNAGFWNYTDAVYSATKSNNSLDENQLPIIAASVNLDVNAFNTCLSSGEMSARVASEVEDSRNSGGSGTPYSVLIPSKPFDRQKLEKFLTDNAIKYGFPTDLFLISNDNKKIGVSGAMPAEFMSNLVIELSK